MRLARLLVCVSLAALAAVSAELPKLRVLDPLDERALFKRVRTLMAQELGAGATDGTKNIHKIALVGNDALVLLEERESAFSPWTSRYVPYSLDLATGRRERIETVEELYLLETVETVRVDGSGVPDLVVKYQDCLDCEGDLLLSSFRYDAARSRWTMRRWNGSGEGIPVGREDYRALGLGDGSEGETVRTFFHHRWADLDGDGRLEIAVEHRSLGIETRTIFEAGITVYTAQDDALPRELADATERGRVHAVLCAGERSFPICSARSSLLGNIE